MRRPIRLRLALVTAALLAATIMGAMPGTAAAVSKPGCGGWRYTNITRQTDSLKTLLGPYSYTNTTANNQSFSLTRTVTGTVGLTTSVTVSATADFFVGKVEAATGVNVSKSLSVSVSITGNMVVSPRHIGYLSFGVVRVVTKGHLYYTNSICGITQDYGTVTVYAPAHEGFIAKETAL